MQKLEHPRSNAKRRQRIAWLHIKIPREPKPSVASASLHHSGGRQFATKNDPDWKTLAQWVTRGTEQKE
jgi:hypothetical protein